MWSWGGRGANAAQGEWMNIFHGCGLTEKEESGFGVREQRGRHLAGRLQRWAEG